MKRNYILIISLFYLVVVNITAQNFDFSANNTNGCDSLNVLFTINDVSNVTSASWDFGNGDTFTGITPPEVTYPTVGVYTVSVVINSSETITKEEYIGVYPTPSPVIFQNDSTIPGSYYVAFTIPPVTAPFDTVKYFYDWNFGDGITFTANNRQHGHRYPDDGTYNVSLTMRDGYGCSAQTEDVVTVTDRFHASNIFTPNDDKINDDFVIETNGLTVYSLVIFTRTGTVVYKTESPLLRWDGRNNAGVKMSP